MMPSTDSQLAGPATRIIIDTDPGIDDAAAILLALASPELSVLGLTAAAGNVGLDKTVDNSLRILELAGIDNVPVAAGADRPLIHPVPGRKDEDSVHGADGLGGVLPAEPKSVAIELHAIDFIAAVADEAAVTIVAIAPLTNIALLLARYPGIISKIERLVVMGGARLEGNASAAAEFNAWADPEAAARVFASGIPITLFPLDITHQAVLSRAEVDELACTGSVGAAMAEMIRLYERQHLVDYGEHFSPLHDVLTTLFLIRPELMTYVAAAVTVDCGTSESRGATLVRTSKDPRIQRNAVVGVSLDRSAFARVFIDRISALDARLAARSNPV
jgi:pyrimidine-specific ribonucleoside hydrolase